MGQERRAWIPIKKFLAPHIEHSAKNLLSFLGGVSTSTKGV